MIALRKSLNCDGRDGVALLGAAALLVVPGIAAPFMRAHFAYERQALAAGELWRAITAHFVHLDFSHAVLNAIGLVLVWALFRHGWSGRQWLFVIAVTVFVIDVCLWFFQPRVEWYVGASGVLHGLIAAGLVAQWRSEPVIATTVAVLLAAKLAFEMRQGALPFAGDAPVVLPAHLYGAIGGAAAALALTLHRKWL